MTVVYGVAADSVGSAYRREVTAGGELTMRSWSSPASSYRTLQPTYIPVSVEHDGPPVGRVVHIELRHQRLWAVCEVAEHVAAEVAVKVGSEIRKVSWPMHFSSQWHADPDDRLVLDALALTLHPARVGAVEPVTFLHGKQLNYREAPRAWGLAAAVSEMLQRAGAARWDREPSDPIVVRDVDQQRTVELDTRSFEDYQPQAKALRYSAWRGQVLSVR